jgi:hypothetical protein
LRCFLADGIWSKFPLLTAFRPRVRRKYIFGIFMIGCSLGGSSSTFRAKPKIYWGGPLAPTGPLIHFFGFNKDAVPSAGDQWWPRAATGECHKKRSLVQHAWRWCFFRPYGYYWPVGWRGSFCAARKPIIGHSALPLCLLPCLAEGKQDQGGRSSLVLRIEESQKICVYQERRRRKECSFHGCMKANARVPGSLCAKCRIKKRVVPSVVHPRHHHRVAPRGGGVVFVGWHCCCG